MIAQLKLSPPGRNVSRAGGRIVHLVLDGAGGLRDAATGKTALELAHTPHLDRVTRTAACGQLELVSPGIRPGSVPGHLALFGYDPLKFHLERGVLAAIEINFDLRDGDIAACVNFATIRANGDISDRRPEGISTALARRLCKKIRTAVKLDFDGEYFLEPVGEHRAVLVLRGRNLAADIHDTDPQSTGVPPREPEARSVAARSTAQLLRSFLADVHTVLDDEDQGNAMLLRGFQRYTPLPTLDQRFGLQGMCIARSPLYRRLSRLLGIDVTAAPDDLDSTFELLAQHYNEAHNFYLLHAKVAGDAVAETDFACKVAVLEAVDRHIPALLKLHPEVLVVSTDHSTCVGIAGHSWHPVPVLIYAPGTHADAVDHFDEVACRRGGLGLLPGKLLMGLALAHATRLSQFGA
ncbi:MAG: phosphoglycerate mutase [Thiogranum sp.]|nr:phosphoglycerate mutase [Thiogranum sp.]